MKVVYGHGSSVPVTVKHHESTTDKPYRAPPKNLSEIEQVCLNSNLQLYFPLKIICEIWQYFLLLM